MTALQITVIHLFLIPYTSCSINPARSLGPAIVSGIWGNRFWVFIIGPILGAVVSVPFHKFFSSEFDWHFAFRPVDRHNHMDVGTGDARRSFTQGQPRRLSVLEAVTASGRRKIPSGGGGIHMMDSSSSRQNHSSAGGGIPVAALLENDMLATGVTRDIWALTEVRCSVGGCCCCAWLLLCTGTLLSPAGLKEHIRYHASQLKHMPDWQEVVLDALSWANRMTALMSDTLSLEILVRRPKAVLDTGYDCCAAKP